MEREKKYFLDRKIIIPAVLIVLILFLFLLNRYQEVTRINIDGYYFTSNNITNNLTNNYRDKKPQVDYNLVEKNEILYKSGIRYYIGEKKKQEINMEYPIISNDKSQLLILSSLGDYIDSQFRKTKAYANTILTNGELYNEINYERVDDLQYYFLSLNNGVFINLQELEITNNQEKNIIPIHSFISFQENSLRYYYLENKMFMYKEINGLDYTSKVKIKENTISYEDLLSKLEIVKQNNEDNQKIAQDYVEENSKGNNSEVGDQKENNIYVKPEVSFSNEKTNIYSMRANLQIVDKAAKITRNPTFEFKIGNAIYMRKTFTSSGTIEISGLMPNTEYTVIGYFYYLNEKGNEVKKTFYENTIRTQDITNLEILDFNIESIESFSHYVTLKNIALENNSNDEVLKGLQKISITIGEKEYQLAKDSVRKLAKLQKLDYESSKSLNSNTTYEGKIKAYDLVGNELKIKDNTFTAKTSKEVPTAKIKVQSVDINKATIQVKIVNKDNVALTNLKYIIYDENHHIIEENNLNGEIIQLKNLDINHVYTIEVYSDYDLEDGKGIIKSHKMAEESFITQSISSLGYVKLDFEEQEITQTNAKYRIFLNEETTNNRLIELLDHFVIKITEEKTKEVKQEININQADVMRLKAGEGYFLNINGLTSKTSYDIEIITYIKVGSTIYDLQTLSNVNSFKTLKQEAKVNIINKFITENLIDFDVQIEDIDGAILSNRVLLEVRTEMGSLVSVEEIKINDDYVRITLDKLSKETTYTFTYIAEEYNIGYENNLFEENKTIYQESIKTEIGLYGKVELAGLLKQVTSKNIFDIKDTSKWKSSGNDIERKSVDLSKNTIYLAAKNGYRSYNYYLKEYVGKTLTVSFEAKYSDKNHTSPVYIGNGLGNVTTKLLENLTATGYTKYTYTFTLGSTPYFTINVREVANQNDITTVEIRNMQIEEGKEATSYTKYTEKKDYQAEILSTITDTNQEITNDTYYLRVYKNGESLETIDVSMNNQQNIIKDQTYYQAEPNEDYEIKLSVKIRNRFYDLSSVTFSSESEIRAIETIADFYGVHATANYIVVNDLDFRGSNSNISDTFYGTIDFQGHQVIRSSGTSPANANQMINILGRGGVFKNIDLHLYLNNVNARSNFFGIANQNSGTIENLKITIEESTNVANVAFSLISNTNYGTISNFAIYAKQPLIGMRTLSLGVATNYGTIKNGYTYGENIKATFENPTTNNKYVGVIADNATNNSSIQNIYSLVGVDLPDINNMSSYDYNVGNVLANMSRTVIQNVYTNADGNNRNFDLDANIVSGTVVDKKNLFYVSNNIYAGTYSNKLSKIALRNKEFQEKLLNGDNAFNVQDFVSYGYYPQLNWPDVMPNQDYISLPIIQDEDLIDIISLESVKQNQETAEVVLIVNNPSEDKITDIQIQNLTTKIKNQENEQGKTKLTIEVSNPIQYVTDYDVRSISSTGAFNIPYVREYQKKEKTLTLNLYKPINNITEFNQIKNSLSENYQLMKDLDFKNVPVTSINNYRGKFNGNNHTIRNIEITSGENIFHNVYGTIENLRFENYKKKNKSYGGVLGYLQSGSVVNNVHVKNIETVGSTYIGGIAGYSNNSTIMNSSVTDFKVSGLEGTSNIRVGGLIGEANNTYIHNSYTQEVDIEVYDANITYGIGGLIGRFNSGNVENCYAEGNINSNAQEIGGLAGYNSGTIVNSLTKVNIYTQQDSIGGIVGYSTNSNINNTLSLGDIYSSKNTINLNRTIGNRPSSSTNFAWASQMINGVITDYANGDILVSTEDLNNELIYKSIIRLGDYFDYSEISGNRLPKLKDEKTYELLPNQKDIYLTETDFKVKDVYTTQTLTSAIIQILINNPQNYEIDSIKIDDMKINKIRRNYTSNGESIIEVEATPEKYYDSYRLREINYIDSDGKVKKLNTTARINVTFYKDIANFEDWQKMSTTNYENYRLIADIDFKGKKDIKTNLMINRLEGTEEGHSLKNIDLTFNAQDKVLIKEVVSSISKVNFENITITNTAANGNYTGIIKNLNGVLSDLDFNNITIKADGLSYVAIVGNNQSPDIRNINLKDINVTGKGYISAFLARSRSTDITNVTLDTIEISADGNYVGGLAAYKDGGTTNFNINGNHIRITNLQNYTGALYGGGSGSTSTLNDVEIKGKNYVGGLAGSCNNTNQYDTITNSKIYGSEGNIGGLCGNNSNIDYAYLEKVEVYGTSEDTTSVGGISGSGGSTISYSHIKDSIVQSLGINTGGIKGVSTGNINQCQVENTKIEGRENVGGILGSSVKDNSAGVYYCSSNAQVLATNSSAGGLVGYLANLRSERNTSTLQFYRNIVADSNITANYLAGGLFGGIETTLEIGNFYGNLVAATISTTDTSENQAGALIGAGDSYANDIVQSNNDQIKIYENTKVNGKTVKSNPGNLNENNFLTRDQLMQQGTYTGMNLTTSYFDFSNISQGYFANIKNAIKASWISLPTEIGGISTKYLLKTKFAQFHKLPDVYIYPVDVDKINVEFEKVDEVTTFEINGKQEPINQRTYTYQYNFKDDFQIILTDGINTKKVTVKKEDIRNTNSTIKDKYYYLKGEKLITNDKEITKVDKIVNLYDDKLLLDNNDIYDMTEKNTISNYFENLTQVKQKPLYEFEYIKNNIKTYYKYSMVNNEIIEKQLFVKDNNLEIIDPSLNNINNKILIDYYNGKNSIVYLGTNNQLYNLKDKIQFPERFKNRNIKSISTNLLKDSELLLVEYEDGNYVVFNYHTGKLVAENKDNKENIISYFKAAFTINNPLENKDEMYKQLKKLKKQVEEKPISEILLEDNENVTVKEDKQYTSIYNPVTTKYSLYELPVKNSQSVTSIKEVLESKSVDEVIKSNTKLQKYYNYQQEKPKNLLLSSVIIILGITTLIILTLIILAKLITKGKKEEII